jgi:AcrR family transcriptional regulator
VTAKARGPYAKSARIQADVIEKATKAFAERGFAGTSMREIAIAVGMTQQGLSHHFPSKIALLEAVLEHRSQAGVEFYTSAHMSVVDTLREIARDIMSSPGLIQLSTMLGAEAISPQHPAHAFFQEHWASARAVFERLVRRGQASGEIRDDVSPPQLATLLVSIFEGLQLQWLSGPGVDMLDGVDTAIQVLAPLKGKPRGDKKG